METEQLRMRPDACHEQSRPAEKVDVHHHHHSHDQQRTKQIVVTRDRIESTRGRLVAQLTVSESDFRLALLLWRHMLDADQLEELSIDTSAAHTLVERLVEVAGEHIVHSAEKEMLTAALPLARITLAIGSFLEEQSELNQRVRFMRLVDRFQAETFKAFSQTIAALKVRVAALSDAQLAGIDQMLAPLEQVRDEYDAPENGTLKHGLETWALERVGVPISGGAAAHDSAVRFYCESRVAILRSLPVRDQIAQLHAVRGLSRSAEEKAIAAEVAHGVRDQICADQIERHRTKLK